jgi:hypothetical protein
MAVGVGALVLVGVVAGGAVLGRWDFPFVDDPPPPLPAAAGAGAEATTDAPTCGPDGTVPVADPPASTVEVLNGTVREGLASTTAEELAARGFAVTRIGNTRLAVTGATEIRYPPLAQAQALTVSAHVGSTQLVADPDTTAVIVTLGVDFAGLRPPEEAAALLGGEVLPGCRGVPEV